MGQPVVLHQATNSVEKGVASHPRCCRSGAAHHISSSSPNLQLDAVKTRCQA